MANRRIYRPFHALVLGEPRSFTGRLQLGLVTGFLPGLLFNLFSVVFFMADVHYRSEQPLHELSSPQPAEQNLLLDYISPDPVSIIFKALSNGHYRVALFSFLAFTGTYSVVVAGGIFSIDLQSPGYRLLLNRTNFYASFTILIIYLLILPFARAPSTFQYPRKWLSILNTISYVHDSHILASEEFEVDAKTDEEIHFQARVVISKRKWCFGMYKGINGRRHLGISPSEIPGAQPDEVVKIVDSIKPGFSLFGFYFKQPDIVPAE